MEPKTYKKIIEMMLDMNTGEEYTAVYGTINRSFEAEKITFKDYNTLHELLSRLDKWHGTNTYYDV